MKLLGEDGTEEEQQDCLSSLLFQVEHLHAPSAGHGGYNKSSHYKPFLFTNTLKNKLFLNEHYS